MADDILNAEAGEVRQPPSWMTRYTEIESEPDAPSTTEALGAGFRRENLLYNALDAMSGTRPDDIDPDYRWADHKDELLKDLPVEMHADIARQPSLEQAQYERDRKLADIEDMKIISDSGVTGVAASLIGGIVSPENFIPWAAAANWAAKGNRLRNAVATGTLAAGTAGATEAFLASQDATKDGEDVLYAASFGFALGGAIGGAIKPRTAAGAPAAEVVGEVADAAPAAATRTETPEVAPVMGPPRPIVTTREATVSSGRAAVRRDGPIDVQARVEAEEVLDSLTNLGTVSKAKMARTQEEVARSLSRLDPEANVGSDVAARLDEAYQFAGIEPRGTKTITIQERVAGSWDELSNDMQVASNQLRTDMTQRVADDIMMDADDAGAMRNRLREEQIVDTSGSEDDILEAANEWAAENNIAERLKADKTNTAALKSKILSSDFTRLVNHPSNVVRRMSVDLLEGGTGTLGRQRTAAIYKDVYERRILSKGLIPLNEQYSIWAKDQGLSFYKRNFHTSGYDQFYRDVRSVLEARTNNRPAPTTHPAVLEAADRWDDMMEEALTIGQKAGWEALEGIPTRKGYVPLVWKGDQILQMGKRKSIRLISQGYRSVGVPDEMADEIAAAVVKRALDGTAGVDTNIAGLLQKNQRGQLRAALSNMGFTEERINGMMRVLDAREAKAGPSFTKGRTNIDLNITIGGKSLLDLVDNDLNAIASKYARDVAGRSALAKKGFTNDTIWNNWKSAALKDNARIKGLMESGDDDLSQYLDDVKSYFTATPIAGGINKNARRIQQLATLSSLGMVGAAQLAELGTVIGRLGLKAAAKNMPAVEDIATLARKVKRNDPVIDELRPLLGDFDYDHLLYRPDIQIDDKTAAAMDMSVFGKVFNGKRLDQALGRGNVMLGYASGMNSVRHLEHRMAAKMMINKFADLALNPSKLAEAGVRMEDIGLDGPALQKVITQINRHAEVGDNGTITALNLTRWPEEVAEDFALAINRHTAQVVQRQLSGETSNWMHKTVGSLLTQFRHFPMVAFEKQLLRNLRYHDQAFYSTLLYGFAVSYGIQSIKAALSDDERTQEDIIKQTVNYMGMASVLPEIGTLANQMGLAPEVLNTRKLGHTGSRPDEFDIIDYVPAAGQVNKLANVLALPGRALSEDGASNAEIRAAAMALPFATTIFGKSLMQVMLEED